MVEDITITNGSGSGEVINGTYTVTANVPGYDNASISPSSINIIEGTDTYAFTIAADGTLTIHVTEEGTAGGTPIVGATFVRTDSAGTQYGDVITSDASGNAVFDNVPFGTGASSVYFRQTASDGAHEFDTTIQTVTLSAQTQTLEIQNAVGATRTISLTDSNYENLPIESATLTLQA